ncbi:MAG TPA: hypothetical protein VLE49_10425 [Anaerolineales bacterium]|nr:hypothetical protein [Anaerolineales bacterium]
MNSGATTVITPVEDWCAGIPIPGYGSAIYANNQPYLQLVVPKSASDKELTAIFKLGPAEAIVLIGLTPPPEKYFGFHPFLRTKVNPDGKRLSLWATLGDAVNNATVKTTGHTPFNSPVALIFTPDQGTDARVRAALLRAGYPAEIINTVVFPASMLNLGHGDTADELNITMRNAMWEKGTEADGDAYIRNPPLHLFRVTPGTETIANPFPAPRLRIRGTGQTEMDLMNKLGQLRQGIVAANSGLYPKDLRTQPAAYEGYDYIQRGVDPLGDSRDPFWLAAGCVPEYGSTDEITLADDEFLMVYGANHVATGKATYHSFTVYSSPEGKVPIGGVDDRAFSSTATPYLPNDPAAANLMYAYKISRNCGKELNCVPLAIENCPRLTIGPNTMLALFFRMYLEPATKVGPAMPEILYDRVIKFSPRPQEEPQPCE